MKATRSSPPPHPYRPRRFQFRIASTRLPADCETAVLKTRARGGKESATSSSRARVNEEETRIAGRGLTTHYHEHPNVRIKCHQVSSRWNHVLRRLSFARRWGDVHTRKILILLWEGFLLLHISEHNKKDSLSFLYHVSRVYILLLQLAQYVKL